MRRQHTMLHPLLGAQHFGILRCVRSKMGIKHLQMPLYHSSYHGFHNRHLVTRAHMLHHGMTFIFKNLCLRCIFNGKRSQASHFSVSALLSRFWWKKLYQTHDLLRDSLDGLFKEHLRWFSVPANRNLLTVISQIILNSVTVTFPWKSELCPPIQSKPRGIVLSYLYASKSYRLQQEERQDLSSSA